MTSTRYPHLSPGYIDTENNLQGLTLGASYFREFFSGRYNLKEMQLFPQRIPKTGFFSELTFLEKDGFTVKFNDTIQTIIKKIENDRSATRYQLNHLNILTRFGVCKLPAVSLNNIDNNLLLDLKLIQTSAVSNAALSNDLEININDIFEIAKQAFNLKGVSDRIKILAGNRLIVSAYRFSKDKNCRNYAREIAPAIMKILDTSEDSLQGQLYKSVAYRGIAMINELGDTQDDLLNQAEEIARNIKGASPLEEVLVKENLYTLLQTLSKWRARAGNDQIAEENLLEMLRIDPYDSTAYSEIGLFLSEKNRYEEAAPYFKQAAILGPPSVGMNLYFYAKCVEKTGNDVNLAELLEQVILADPDSISARLDLFDWYEKNRQIKASREIAQAILNTGTLLEQLENNERERLEKSCSGH